MRVLGYREGGRGRLDFYDYKMGLGWHADLIPTLEVKVGGGGSGPLNSAKTLVGLNTSAINAESRSALGRINMFLWLGPK